MYRKLLNAAIWVSIGLLLGRLSGFFRELTLAAKVGADFQADLCVLLLTFPDLMNSILFGGANGGALGLTLIPEFKKHKKENAFQAFCQILLFALILSIIVTGLMILGSSGLIKFLAPGFDPKTHEMGVSLLEIVAAALPFTLLGSVATAYLQANERFVTSSLGTLIHNIILIICLTQFKGPESLPTLMKFVVVGSACRLLFLFFEVFLIKGHEKPRWRPLLSKDLLRKYIQTTITGSLIFLFPVLARQFISFGKEGTLALFNYSTRIAELPVLVLSILSVVLFPRMSEMFSKNPTDPNGTRVSRKALRLILISSVTISVSTIWFISNLDTLPIQWKKAATLDFNQFKQFIWIALIGLPAQAMSSILLSIFNAKHATESPLKVNLLGILVYIPSAWALQKQLGPTGPIIALVSVYSLTMMLQLYVLQTKHSLPCLDLIFSLDGLKSFIPSLLIIIALNFSHFYLPSDLLIQLTAAALMATFAFIFGFFGINEVKKFTTRLTKND